MAINVVEILVRAKDTTKEGFAEANASASALGEKLSKIGLVAGAGLAAVGYEAAKMAIGFDAQMTMLNTQAGVSQSKMAQLRSGVLALAGQVGFSPDSLAESLYHVASNMSSMGASSAKMLDVVKVAAEGARTGGADLVDVTNALTAAVASGIPGVQNYQQAMGMLNATVGSGDMKMQDLAEAFGSGMVATVKGFGLSLKDVGAALAVFGDNNIRGAHAGTQLRMSVMALASPAKAGVTQFQQWGMATNQLARDMQSGGLMKALDDLQAHFRANGITAKEQGMVITNDFGKKAGAGLNVLMDQMDRLKSKYPAITAGADKFGQAWGTTQGTLKQQLAELQGSFDALMITIGQKLIPVIQAVVGWMLKNKGTVLVLLAAVGSLAAALAAYAVIAKTVAMVTGTWEVASKGAALALKGIKAGVQIGHDFAAGFNDANAAASAFSGWAGTLGGQVSSLGSTLSSAGSSAASFVSGYVSKIGQAVTATAAWIAEHAAAAASFIAENVMMAASATAAFIAENLATLGIIAAVAALVAAVVFLATHWKQVWHDILAVIDAVVSWIKAHWPLIFDILTGPVGMAVRWIVQHWSQIVAGAEHMVSDVISFFTGLPGRILHALAALPGELFNFGIHIIEGLISGMLSMGGSLISAGEHLAGDALSSLGHALGIGSPSRITRQHGVWLVQGLIDGMDSMNGALGAAAGRVSRTALPGSGRAAYGAYAGSGMGGGVVRVQIDVSGGDEMFISWLKSRIRQAGGGGPTSVQKALGQGVF